MQLSAALAIFAMALVVPGQVAAQQPSAGATLSEATVPEPEPVAIVFDIFVLRPLGMAATIIGVALFVPVAIMTAPAGEEVIESAQELFVFQPAKNTFQRPLGDF